MAVADNFNFSLLDVLVEFGEWTAQHQQLPELGLDSLRDCFDSNYYNADGFSAYGDPDTLPNTLREFRGYDHSAVPFTPSLNVSTQTIILNLGGTYTVNVTSNTSWSMSISYISGGTGWASLSSTSGTGSDADPTITYTANGLSDPERSLTITTTGGGITRTNTITQSAGKNYGGSQ